MEAMTMIEERSDPYEVRPDTSNIMLENSIEFQQWLNDPAAKEKFGQLIKDIPLSNLDSFEKDFLMNCLDFSYQLKENKLKEAADFFQFVGLSVANVSLGKGGFARKRVGAQKLEQEITKTDTTKKAFWGQQPKKG
jgi:hypothetical protein